MKLLKFTIVISFILIVITTGCSQDKYENEDNLIFIGASENWYIQFEHTNKTNNIATLHYIGNDVSSIEKEGIATDISGTRYAWSHTQTFPSNKVGTFSAKVQGIEVWADKKEKIRVEIRWDNYKKQEVIELIYYK